MTRLFRQASAPYVATVLLAACGWGIVHVVDRLTAAPSVEYCVDWAQADQNVTVTVENLSITSRIERFHFALRSDDGTFADPHLRGNPPASWRLDPPVPTPNAKTVPFYIPTIHPGAVFVASVEYNGHKEPTFVLDSAAVSTRLWKCSPLTVLLKNELAFVLGFSAVALAVVFCLIYFSAEGKTVDELRKPI